MRLWNSRESALDEALKGIMRACPGKYTRLPSEYGYGLYRNNLPENQVRIIVNGTCRKQGRTSWYWAGMQDLCRSSQGWL